MKNKLLAQFHFSRVRPNDKQVEFKNIAQEPLLTHRNSILEYTPMGRTQNPLQSCGNNEFKSLRSHYYVSLSSQRKRDCNSTVDYEVAYKNAALFERQGNEALEDMTSDGIRREHGASNNIFTPHSSKENCVSLNFHTFPLGEQQDCDTTSKGSISQSTARNADMSKDEGFGAAIEDGEVCKVKDAQVEDVVETEVGNRCSEKAIVNKFVGGSCIEDNDPVLYNIDCWQLDDQIYELVKDLSHLESLYQHNKENCEKEIKVATGLEVGFEGLVEMKGEVESWDGSPWNFVFAEATSKEVVNMGCTKGTPFLAVGQINNGGLLNATRRSGDREETPKVRGLRPCSLCLEFNLAWKIVLVPLWIWKELRRNYLIGVYHVLQDWDNGPLFVNLSFLHSLFPLVVSPATRCSFPRVSIELEVEFFSKLR